MQMKFNILILAVLAQTVIAFAQKPVKTLTTEEEQKIWATDSIAIKMADKMVNDNLNLLVSDKLDSLVNTWYIKNAFVYDKSEFDSLPEEMKTYLPDSVYISRLQAIDSFLPLPYNQTVRNFIGLYTIRKRDLTSYIYGLSNYYFPVFEEALERYQLPHELKYLPIIESALNPKAFSRAGASGLWQFMIGTGKLYGLEVNSYVDERNDPNKATDAAARYLRVLYAIYVTWTVVIAAYNCGPGNINKAVRRSGGKQTYWEIYNSLPRETRGYIPVFIAASYMMHYGKEHQIKAAEPKFNTLTDTLEVHSYLNFEQLAAIMNISVEQLRQLNPQYRRDIIPARAEKSYLLKIDGKIVGGYILEKTGLPMYPGNFYDFSGEKLTGVEGVSLFVDPNYKSAGIGHKLKYYYKENKHPEISFIWGMAFHGLNNMNHWLKTRTMFNDLFGVYYTIEFYTPGGVNKYPKTKYLDFYEQHKITVVDYINSQLKKGKKLNSITSVLADYGFDKSEVMEITNYCKKE